jgi:hypothetical protein
MKVLSMIFLVFAGLLPIGSIASRVQERVNVEPRTGKVEFENQDVRVTRVEYGAHEKTPMGEHGRRFNVAITESDVRLTLADGTPRRAKHAAHEFYWSEPEVYTVENLSDGPIVNIEVAMKRSKGASVEVTPVAKHSKASGTETDPVPVEEEPHHRIVFENQYVRVLEVILQPGENALYHTHSLDNVSVQIGEAELGQQPAGEEWKKKAAKDGEVGFRDGTKHPYTHRVGNMGKTVFHVLDIEILP